MPRLAWGWNATGHEVVAQVAWDELTPAQRAALVGVLSAHPRYEKDLKSYLRPGEDVGEHVFREAATWPDMVRTPTNPLSGTEHHPTWHYVDFPLDRDDARGPVPSEKWDGHSPPTDLLEALQMCTAQLRDPATPAPRRAIALCWVLHLVGDVHQPLHATNQYSRIYPPTTMPSPGGDQGGNLVHVASPDNPDTNLHSLWDGIEGRSFDPAVIRKVADRVEHDHPRSAEATALQSTDPDQWAHESFDLAQHAVYLDGKIVGVPRGSGVAPPPLPVGYEQKARAVADERIALAGYRLADLLRSLPALKP